MVNCGRKTWVNYLKSAQNSWNDIRNVELQSQGCTFVVQPGYKIVCAALFHDEYIISKGVFFSRTLVNFGRETWVTWRMVKITSCSEEHTHYLTDLTSNFNARFGSHLVAFNVKTSPRLVCVPAALQMRISTSLHLCKQYSWKRTLDHLQGGRSVHYERKVTVSFHFSCGDHLKHCSSFPTTSMSPIYSFMWWCDCSLLAKSGTPCQLYFC